MAKTRLVEHLVRAGECVASIAASARTSLEALWTLPENAELRQTRDDPYVLAPGDRVQVPVAEGQRHTLATGMRHVFRRIATHTDFEVTARLARRPRADIGFVLVLDGDEGHAIEGTTDGASVVRARIPASARRGVLRFADGRGTMSFGLGELDPLATMAGIQGRLRDLGYYAHAVDGIWGPRTARALRNFQRAHALPVTGRADDATVAGLRGSYGR